MLHLPIEVAAMKTAALLAAASLLLASSAFAQSSAPSNPGLPPPGINDPGVQPVAPPAKVAPTTTHKAGNQQNLPSMQDTGDAGDSKHMSLPPQVSVREEDGDQVQEYRRSGMLYMVVVTPKKGIPQTYMVDPDGTRRLVPGESPVQPVMYKVLEWGKSKPAEADSTEATQSESGH
jgi:Protein of unknown function (DUF2782)